MDVGPLGDRKRLQGSGNSRGRIECVIDLMKKSERWGSERRPQAVLGWGRLKHDPTQGWCGE
eukprot:414601-Prymnesium_polylepis.1